MSSRYGGCRTAYGEKYLCGESGFPTILKGMNTGFRYETVSETERGRTCLDRLTGDTVEFVREGMYFKETNRTPRRNTK